MTQIKQNIFKYKYRGKSKRKITKHLNFRISGQYIPQISQAINRAKNQAIAVRTPQDFLSMFDTFATLCMKRLMKILYFSLFNSNLKYIVRYEDKTKIKN